MDERNKLLMEIEALEEQVQNYTNDLEKMDRSGQVDAGTYNALIEERKTAQAKLEGKRSSLAEIDGAAETAKEELSIQFGNIVTKGADGEDMSFTLDELVISSAHYAILKDFLNEYIGDMTQKNAAVLQSYRSENERLREGIQLVKDENHLLSDRANDAELKRDAAAQALAESEEEKKRLAADNESLRKQLEATNQPSQTNLNTNLAEEAKKIYELKPAIYNKRWEDENRKTHYLATLASNGEQIKFGFLEAGKYREVTAEEAETFRAEAITVPEANVDESSSLVTVTPPPFHFRESATDDVDQHEPVPANDAPITREEFEALKADVEGIKRTIGIEVAA